MTAATKSKRSHTAEHRPATRRRRFKNDDLVAVDLFSGFGGLTQGIERAGFTTIMAANHNRYKVEVHEANHPHAEHWIADLVDDEAGDYHSAADLPPADALVAGVSCVNHSQANAQKAYAQAANLFTFDDPEWEARVTRSERDRATAVCVLQYAAKNHPRVILVECTTELQSWGPAVQGRPNVGDGTTFRWWLNEFDKLGYRHRILFLNSQFFGVPQSRDRLYIVMWDQALRAPDLEHRPPAWCHHCEQVVEARWSWRTGIPPTGSVRYGKQYDYRCPSCAREVVPPMTPSIVAIDLSNLGTKIGNRERPLAPATMARIERCRRRFADFPAVLMPAKSVFGSERHPWQPLGTQTSRQETALVSTGALMVAAGHTYEHPGSDCRTRTLADPLWTQHATNAVGLLTPPVAMAVDNYQGAARPVDGPLPTQVGSETLGLLAAEVIPNRTNATPRCMSDPSQTVTAGAGSGGMGILSTGVIPFRQNTVPTTHAEPMPTFTADQIPGLITAAGFVKNNGSIDEAGYRAHPLSAPLGTQVAGAITHGVLSAGWIKQNGGPADTAAHPLTDPLGTLTARDTTALLFGAGEHIDGWAETLASIPTDELYWRMFGAPEVGRGCGFDVTFGSYQGSYIVWGSARDQTDGFGNAVSPQVGQWIGERLRVIL